jgi:putative ABC transport system permease protein
VLGVPLAAGREFTVEEDRAGGPPVAIISHELAVRLFEEAVDAVGRTLRLKGEPYLVVGVAPLDFVSGDPADVWAPLRPSRQGEGEGANYKIVVQTPGDLSLLEAETATALLLEEIFDRRLCQDASGRKIVARLRLLPLQEGLTRQQE